jgi:hypothetical protein
MKACFFYHSNHFPRIFHTLNTIVFLCGIFQYVVKIIAIYYDK